MEDGGLPDPLLPRAPFPVLPDEQGGVQALLRGLPGTQPVSTAHEVQSLDWYHPVAAELRRQIWRWPTVATVTHGWRSSGPRPSEACRAALAVDHGC